MVNQPEQTMPPTRPKAEDVAKYLLVKKGSLTGQDNGNAVAYLR